MHSCVYGPYINTCTLLLVHRYSFAYLMCSVILCDVICAVQYRAVTKIFCVFLAAETQ